MNLNPDHLAQIKELRHKTGLGIIACKDLLSQSNYDLEVALSKVKDKVRELAATRAGRSTEARRVVGVYKEDSVFMCEFSCETEFAADSNLFVTEIPKICRELANHYWNSQQSQLVIPSRVAESLTSLSGILKEKVNIDKQKFYRGTVGKYMHKQRAGVVVALSGGTREIAEKIAFEYLMHQSKYILELPHEVIEQATAEVKELTTLASIQEKALAGKLDKLRKRDCFVYQQVTDSDRTIADLLGPDTSIVEISLVTTFLMSLTNKIDSFLQAELSKMNSALKEIMNGFSMELKTNYLGRLVVLGSPLVQKASIRRLSTTKAEICIFDGTSSHSIGKEVKKLHPSWIITSIDNRVIVDVGAISDQARKDMLDRLKDSQQNTLIHLRSLRHQARKMISEEPEDMKQRLMTNIDKAINKAKGELVALWKQKRAATN